MGVVGGPASTFNPYLYVRGNPVNLTDPSGRIAPLVAAGLYVGAAALIGGLVGGLVGGVGSLIHQLRQNGGDWSCLDVNAIADSALKSAIIGAVGGAAGALASLGFGAAFAAAGYTGSAAIGALNVAGSSAIGGQFARATANGMAGQSYQFNHWSTLGDAAMGLATFGLFAAGASVWGGARSLSSVADDVLNSFGKAANPLASLTQSSQVGERADEQIGQVQSNVVTSGQRLGDLTDMELAQIQSIVDRAGRPLEVVGSAARGARRPTSDIDYIVPMSSYGYYSDLAPQLPGLDLEHGLLFGIHNPHIGPAIRFEPFSAPVYLSGAAS